MGQSIVDLLDGGVCMAAVGEKHVLTRGIGHPTEKSNVRFEAVVAALPAL